MLRTALAGLALAVATCGSALAQSWPERPIRLVVGFTPGGAADYVGRSVGDALGRVLGQPIIIDNKPGAGSSLAADYVAKAAPDGYTVMLGSTGTNTIAPHLTPKMSFDALNAFSPVTSGRAAALRSVSDSNSVRQAELSPSFVLMQYFGYLRRNPTDAPDSNDNGYQFWLAKLNQFGGNFVKAEMVKAFITSTEYRSRFGQP